MKNTVGIYLITAITLSIICSVCVPSFAEVVSSDNNKKIFVARSENVWAYNDSDSMYYLTLFNNQSQTVDFAFEKVDEFQYFGTLTKFDDELILVDPCKLFSDLQIEIEYDENDLLMTARSETHNIELKSFRFKEVKERQEPLVVNSQIEDGSDWFVTKMFTEDLSLGENLYLEVNQGIRLYSELTDSEKESYDLFYKHISVHPWETQGDGCSWYCGVLSYDVKSSSTLCPIFHNTYNSANIHDYSLLTAWIEGVDGHGIGEYVTIAFPSGNPRVNRIEFFNGYQKSEEAYYNNSRVREMTLFINDMEYGKLNLEDTPRCQSFDIELMTVINSEQKLEFRFRIDEVYPGNLFEDTAISEINFEGIDVH